MPGCQLQHHQYESKHQLHCRPSCRRRASRSVMDGFRLFNSKQMPNSVWWTGLKRVKVSSFLINCLLTYCMKERFFICFALFTSSEGITISPRSKLNNSPTNRLPDFNASETVHVCRTSDRHSTLTFTSTDFLETDSHHKSIHISAGHDRKSVTQTECRNMPAPMHANSHYEWILTG